MNVTNVSEALLGLYFVMASAMLSSPCIHRISRNSLRTQDFRKAMVSHISRRSWVVPSLTITSYNDFESVHMMVGIDFIPIPESCRGEC